MPHIYNQITKQQTQKKSEALFLLGTFIFNKSSVRLSATFVFLIPKSNLGVNTLLGVPGVLLLTRGLGEYNLGEDAANFNFDVANLLAAGDMVANLSKVDVVGLGDGLKTEINFFLWEKTDFAKKIDAHDKITYDAKCLLAASIAFFFCSLFFSPTLSAKARAICSRLAGSDILKAGP